MATASPAYRIAHRMSSSARQASPVRNSADGEMKSKDKGYESESSSVSNSTPRPNARQTDRNPSRNDNDTDENEKDIEKQQSKSEKHQKDDSEKDPNLVEWDGDDDPENPMNFPRWRRWMITTTLGVITLVVTFASSVFSTATMVTAKQFGVSPVVMILGVSLFVAGFAVGPIIWGPLSELYGRKIPLFFGYFIFCIFQIPVAVAENLPTIFLCRFFGGVFGSAPLAIVGGALADMWGPVDRGVAICVFAGAVFIGPVFGPVIGSFVTMSHLGWRWTIWLTAIMGFSFWILALPIIPETYAPVLLQRRAKKLRYQTRNWALHAEADEKQVGPKEIFTKYLARPFTMTFTEPILLLITLYMSAVYGILYLFFESFPIAFEEERGWSPGVGSLPFISILIGVVCGCALIVFTTKTRFRRKLEATGHVVPEERLIPMIIGGAIFPAGLFWFAWTSNPGVPWPAQVVAGIPIGMGVLVIFMQGLNYIIDCYAVNANSAIAANTFMRSLVGAGFPMFATGMYHNLGVNWATSTLGFITAALFPVPILFYIYGAKIRSWSRFTED